MSPCAGLVGASSRQPRWICLDGFPRGFSAGYSSPVNRQEEPVARKQSTPKEEFYLRFSDAFGDGDDDLEVGYALAIMLVKRDGLGGLAVRLGLRLLARAGWARTYDYPVYDYPYGLRSNRSTVGVEQDSVRLVEAYRKRFPWISEGYHRAKEGDSGQT